MFDKKSNHDLTKEEQIQFIIKDCGKHGYEFTDELLNTLEVKELNEIIEHLQFLNDFYKIIR